jgi:hypothetical protein
VKKLLILASAILFAHSGFAKESLRTLDSIEFENGEVQKTGLIADTEGRIFLEFNETVLAVITDGKTKFTGEIMPPEIIVLPARTPRARMREIFTFELLADTGEEISFSDKIDLLNERNRIRLSYNDPDSLVRTAAVKLLSPIKEEFRILALWKYLPAEDKWKRLGGKTNDTSEEDTSVFSAIIWGTGIYSLLDENPSPTFSPTFPIDEIETVEESPFPSVENENLNDNILNDYTKETIFPDQMPLTDNLFDEESVYTTDEEYEIPAIMPLEDTKNSLNQENIPSNPNLTLDINTENQDIEYLSSAEKTEELVMPINSNLPKSGADNTPEKSPKTSIIIFFAMITVGTSLYFSVKKVV